MVVTTATTRRKHFLQDFLSLCLLFRGILLDKYNFSKANVDKKLISRINQETCDANLPGMISPRLNFINIHYPTNLSITTISFPAP